MSACQLYDIVTILMPKNKNPNYSMRFETFEMKKKTITER